MWPSFGTLWGLLFLESGVNTSQLTQADSDRFSGACSICIWYAGDLSGSHRPFRGLIVPCTQRPYEDEPIQDCSISRSFHLSYFSFLFCTSHMWFTTFSGINLAKIVSHYSPHFCKRLIAWQKKNRSEIPPPVYSDPFYGLSKVISMQTSGLKSDDIRVDSLWVTGAVPLFPDGPDTRSSYKDKRMEINSFVGLEFRCYFWAWTKSNWCAEIEDERVEENCTRLTYKKQLEISFSSSQKSRKWPSSLNIKA